MLQGPSDHSIRQHAHSTCCDNKPRRQYRLRHLRRLGNSGRLLRLNLLRILARSQDACQRLELNRLQPRLQQQKQVFSKRTVPLKGSIIITGQQAWRWCTGQQP